MKNPQNNKGILFILLKNSIVQFISGILSLIIIIRVANGFDYKSIQIGLKTFGYGFFCYQSTPFMIYWLAYVSQGIATLKKLTITVALTALYSFIIWDAYFFFREAMQHGLRGFP